MFDTRLVRHPLLELLVRLERRRLVALLARRQEHGVVDVEELRLADPVLRVLDVAVGEILAVLGDAVYSVNGLGLEALVGEMLRELTPLGVRVPPGFAITAAAYRHFIAEAGLEPVLREILGGRKPGDPQDAVERSASIREAMLAAPLPAELQLIIPFVVGVSGSPQNAQATDELVRFLTAPSAAAVLKSKGLNPP